MSLYLNTAFKIKLKIDSKTGNFFKRGKNLPKYLATLIIFLK